MGEHSESPRTDAEPACRGEKERERKEITTNNNSNNSNNCHTHMSSQISTVLETAESCGSPKTIWFAIAHDDDGAVRW
jgi:hypothetical protein